MIILENYLTFLNEELLFKPKCYCNILEFKQYGFEKIFYTGVKNSTEYYETFLNGYNLFFPLTKLNYEEFLEGEDIIVPKFRYLGGEKFSLIKIAKILRKLKILDSGFADVKLPLLENSSIYNFKNMKTFSQNDKIMYDNYSDNKLIFLKLKKGKKL